MDTENIQNPSVIAWYSGQEILITGATGFMGKVLVEKLLRCCPNISKIYLLVRTKRGRDPAQRLDDFINSPVFDNIRYSSKGQNLINKLQCMNGDLAQENLKLSNNDLHTIQNKVTIVFHMAANVRFDQKLKEALLMNTGGTKRVLDLALTMKHLKAFVHVSTSYCHCDLTILEEKMYKSPQNPRKMLDMVQWMDEEVLDVLTKPLLKNAPNTYAYTKCLTEELVGEYSDRLPIAIARPSIVTAAWKEPIPGWVDNLNGPTGLIVGAGKGVIRTMHCDASLEADIMPVDVSINSLILIAWKIGNDPPKKEPFVVNVTAHKDNPVTWGEALELGRKHFYDNPFSICLWYPGGSIKSSYILHIIAVFFLHLIPAYLVDFLLMLTRGKPFLVKTQRRIQNGLEVLQYYTTRPWEFYNEKLKKISANLSPKEKEMFYTSVSEINWDQYVLAYVLGARKYCIHEEPDTIPYARKVLKRLYYLDVAKNVLLGFFFLWMLLLYAPLLLNSMESYVPRFVPLKNQ